MLIKVQPIEIENLNIKVLDEESFLMSYYNDSSSNTDNIFGNLFIGDILICISNSKKCLRYRWSYRNIR